jgi:hypothetical protein
MIESAALYTVTDGLDGYAENLGGFGYGVPVSAVC